PAAAIGVHGLADAVDFLSVGTNALVQYLLAVDRNNDAHGDLYSPLHPGVLRLLAHVLRAGAEHRVPVAVCGEMAGDPRLAPLLLALGLREFSLHPAGLLELRRTIRECDLARLQERAPRLLQARDRRGIERWLESAFPYPNATGAWDNACYERLTSRAPPVAASPPNPEPRMAEAVSHDKTARQLRLLSDALDSGRLGPVRRLVNTLSPAEIG